MCYWLENFSCRVCGAHAGRESFFQLTHGLRRGLHSYAASRLNGQTSCRAVRGLGTGRAGQVFIETAVLRLTVVVALLRRE